MKKKNTVIEPSSITVYDVKHFKQLNYFFKCLRQKKNLEFENKRKI